MNRDEMVDYIVANCDQCSEEDREEIASLSDLVLNSWHNELKTKTEETALKAEVEKLKASLAEKVKEMETVTNQGTPPTPVLTDEQKIDLEFARQVRQERRKALIDKLTANNVKLPKEEWEKLDGGTIEQMASNFADPQPKTTDYSGLTGAAANPTENFPTFGLPGEYLRDDKTAS